jgi:hypothetical protein
MTACVAPTPSQEKAKPRPDSADTLAQAIVTAPATPRSGPAPEATTFPILPQPGKACA